MSPKLVIGNWKMHGGLQANEVLINKLLRGEQGFPSVEVALCVPYVYLQQIQSLLAGTRFMWGAQNVSEYDVGAYTGEVCALMLSDFLCRYVILGHSERRTLMQESSLSIAKKFELVLSAGMVPVLCLGETLFEREAGRTFDILAIQLASVIDRLGYESFADTVVAYEPVWAIGTGLSASAIQVQEVHAFIRKQFEPGGRELASSVRILYGGSVKPLNAHGLFAQPDVDGGLIGGASLVAEDFMAICQSADSAVVC